MYEGKHHGPKIGSRVLYLVTPRDRLAFDCLGHMQTRLGPYGRSTLSDSDLAPFLAALSINQLNWGVSITKQSHPLAVVVD